MRVGRLIPLSLIFHIRQLRTICSFRGCLEIEMTSCKCIYFIKCSTNVISKHFKNKNRDNFLDEQGFQELFKSPEKKMSRNRTWHSEAWGSHTPCWLLGPVKLLQDPTSSGCGRPTPWTPGGWDTFQALEWLWLVCLFTHFLDWVLEIQRGLITKVPPLLELTVS